MRNSFLWLNMFAFSVMLILFSKTACGATITSAGNGNWNNGATWIGGQVPNATDDVIIDNGDNVTLTADASCASLTMNAGDATSRVYINGYTLNVSGTVTMNPPTSNNRKRTIVITTGSLICDSFISVNSTGDKLINSVTITNGTFSVLGNISMGATAVRNLISISGTGTLNIGGDMIGGKFVPGNGTINFNGVSAQTIPINNTYVYNNLKINNPAGATLQAAVTTANVKGNINVESGIFDNGGYAIAGNTGHTFTVANGSTFYVSGSTSVFPTVFNPSLGATSTVIFDGTGSQTIAAVASPGYGNLQLIGGGTKTASGGLSIQSDLLIWGSCTFSADTYTHDIHGDWINQATFSAGTSTFSFTGSSGQFIGGTVASSFYRLIINSSSDITILQDETVTNGLTLTAGNVNTGGNILILPNSATVNGGSAASYVNGNFRKGVSSGTTTKNFEIGDATAYTPVTMVFPASSNSTGSITVNTTIGDHPQISSSEINGSLSVNRYWTIVNSGVTGITPYSATFNFVSGDIDPGATPGSFNVTNYSSSAWTLPVTGTRTSTSTQATGITLFGDFQIGEFNPKKYRTVSSGDWVSTTTWQTSRNSGSTWAAATTFPNFRDGTIEIISPHVVTVTPTAGRDTVDQLTIFPGAELIINVNPSGYWLYFVDGPGTDLVVNGTLEYQDDIVQLLTGATMSVGNGGLFRFNMTYGGNYPITVPTATWDPNSTCEIIASNQLPLSGGLNQSFGHFIWNYPAQTTAINFGGNLNMVNGNFTLASSGSGIVQLTNTASLSLTVGGNFNIQSGTLDFASGAATSKVLNIGGNYNQTGGTFTNSNSNLLTINFTGAGKTFTQSAGTLTSTYMNWVITSPASLSLLSDLNVSSGRTCTVNGILNCGTTTGVKVAGSFILSDNAGLLIGSTDGITASGATGNIQTTSRTFSTNADYTYNGISSQVAGSGLPTTLRNLSISNGSGVALSGNVLVKGTLGLNNGILSVGSNTLAFQTDDIPIIKTTGSIATTSASNLQFGAAGNTAGAAFTLPTALFASAPTLHNLSIYRTNSLTLSDQMLSIQGIVLCSGPLVTNNKLTLLSTAAQTALIDGAGTGQITGNVTIQRYFPSKFGYKYLSSPIQSATVNIFSPYIDLAATFPTFYSYDENKTTSGWVTYTTAGSALALLTGYAGNFGTTGGPLTMAVPGIVNNGIIQKNFYHHNQTYTLGFNLAGNPYPSPINWNAASGWTKTSIDNALYYFNNGTTDQYTGTYSSYVNGVSSDGIANNIIPAMQGFFIHVSNGAYPVTGLLGMTNAVRINTLNPVFHKDAEENEKPLLRMSAFYGSEVLHRDPMVIYLDDEASREFGKDEDALKLFNTDQNYPNLYTLTKNHDKLSINACSFGDDSLFSVPMGISMNKSGKLTLSVENLQNFPDDYYVYLFDSRLKYYQDLRAEPVLQFYFEQGEPDLRFSIVFSKNPVKNKPAYSDILTAYSSSDRIYLFINLGKDETGDLFIYNMIGQPVWKEKVAGEKRAEIRPGVSSGVYIVTLKTGSAIFSSKVFITNP